MRRNAARERTDKRFRNPPQTTITPSVRCEIAWKKKKSTQNYYLRARPRQDVPTGRSVNLSRAFMTRTRVVRPTVAVANACPDENEANHVLHVFAKTGQSHSRSPTTIARSQGRQYRSEQCYGVCLRLALTPYSKIVFKIKTHYLPSTFFDTDFTSDKASTFMNGPESRKS